MDEKKLNSLISNLTDNAPFNEYISDTHDLLNTLMNIELEENDKEIVTNIQKQFQLFFPLHETEKPLPENTPKYYIIDCPFNEIQKIAIRNQLSQSIVDIQNGKFQVLRNSLEKICTHPYLLSGNEIYFRASLQESSPKFDIITKLIHKAIQNNKKIAILSQHLKILDMVHDYCEINNISNKYDIINASVSLLYTKERSTIEDLTNANILVFVDTPLVYITGKKEVYQLLCNDVGENDWDLIDDETLCKYIAIKAFENYETKSTDYLLDNPLEIPKVVSQILVNASEQPNFWDDYLDLKPYEKQQQNNENSENQNQELINDNENKQQQYEQIDREFTIREQNQFLRGLFSFGLNKWEMMREQIALNLSTEELKVESNKVLKLTLDNNNYPEKHYIISDILNKQSVDSKYLKVNPDLINDLSDNSNHYLETIELLEFLHASIPEGSTIETIKNLYCFTDFDPETLNQLPGSSKKHEQWWNDTYDKALLLGYSKFGLNNLDDFALDENEFVRNIFKLTTNVEGLQEQGRRLLHRLRYNYSPEHYVIAFFISDEIKSKWTRAELNLIVNYLSNFGVPPDKDGKEDYASLIEKLSLQNHTEEEFAALVEDIIKNCTKKSKHEEFEHAAELFTDKIVAMRDLHFIIDNRDQESLIESIRKAPKWKNMPKLFTPEIEYIFLTELVKRGFNEVKSIITLPQIVSAFGKAPPRTLFKFNYISTRLHNLAECIRGNFDYSAYNKKKSESSHHESRSKPRSKPKPRPQPVPQLIPEQTEQQQQPQRKKKDDDDEDYTLPKKKVTRQPNKQNRQAHININIENDSTQPQQQITQENQQVPAPEIEQEQQQQEKEETEQPQQQQSPEIPQQQEEPQEHEEIQQQQPEQIEQQDQSLEQYNEQTETTTNTQTDDDPSVSPSSSETEDSEDFYGRKSRSKSRSRSQTTPSSSNKGTQVISNLQRHKMNSKLTYDNLDLHLPLEITQTTKLYSLGEIVTDRPGFHTERYIYPRGYKISRIAKSTIVPEEMIVWYCEIIDTGEDTPLFKVTSEDGRAVYEGATPTAPWSQILRQIAKINGYSGRALSVSGPEQYLLSNKIINNLIMQMPGVDLCKNLHSSVKPKATKTTNSSANHKEKASIYQNDDDEDEYQETTTKNKSRSNRQQHEKTNSKSKKKSRVFSDDDDDDEDEDDLIDDELDENNDEYIEQTHQQKAKKPQKQVIKKQPIQKTKPKKEGNNDNDEEENEEESPETPSDSSDGDFLG